MGTRLLVFVGTIFFALPAVALQPRLVAVVPVPIQHTEASRGDLDTFASQLRDVVHEALGSDGYTVIDDATVHTALKRRKLVYCEDHCAEDAASVLPADLYISGQVVFSGDRYLAAVRLVDRRGRVLSLARLESVSVVNLATQLAAKGEAFFAGQLHEEPIPREIIDEAIGFSDRYSYSNAFELHLEPLSGHGTWSLYGSRGERLCNLPCTRWVGEDSHYLLKPSDDSHDVSVPDSFSNAQIGGRYRATLLQPSDNAMLHPAWLALAAPVSGIASLGALVLGIVLISETSDPYNSIDPGLVGLEIGLIVATALTVWWCVEIFRNMHHNGVDLSPLGLQEPAPTAGLPTQTGWAETTPPTRSEL